jgi:hypothetical protein
MKIPLCLYGFAAAFRPNRWHAHRILPAPPPDLGGLDPETLKALLIAKHNESIEQHKQLRSNSQEIEHLKLVIEKYRRMIFGRKSEKLARELEQLELRLAELAQLTAAIGTRVAMKTVADNLSWQMLGQACEDVFSDLVDQRSQQFTGGANPGNFYGVLRKLKIRRRK